MYIRKTLLFWFLFLSLWCNACKDSLIKPQVLQGYWALQSATREAQPTTTLDGMWLAFDANKTFSTNLPLGLTGQETWQIAENQIQISAQPPLVLDVVNMTDSTMEVAFQTRGILFTMQLAKTEKPAETPDVSQPVEQ